MDSSQHIEPNGVRTAGGASTGTAYPWLKSYPAGVDWFTTFRPTPLPELFDSAASRFPGSPPRSFFGKAMSYKELSEAVDRAAKGLQAIGVKKGTRVGLLFPNCPAFVIYYYAALKAGATVVGSQSALYRA